MRRYVIGGFIVILAILAVVAAGFVIYTKVKTLGPEPEALAALESTDDVEVTTDGLLVFRPKNSVPETGFIFYPGGLVDPRSYAPMARDIASAGHLAVIVPMPFNLAVFSPGKAAGVIEEHPGVQNWAIGGHSLGGAMASRYARQNPNSVSGLALWAAWPADSDDLSGSDLAVTSIYGTEDGVATVEEIENSRRLLPADAEFVPIPGGNHAQFGWYGPQGGDNPAAISPAEQQAQIVAATVALLERLQPGGP
jgi:dienelactone hydrolase